ncbi:hypothetical protein [uncultured Amnibacterium sp.]|uniref:hypothetical protein n=1 Tax=uncultured Amnibacterium sp. TaxID=1631851 RepID=UPI0035CBB470
MPDRAESEALVFELRTYTLRDRASAVAYAGTHWARHVPSLATFGITTHGVWLEADGRPVVRALVSFAAGVDPVVAGRAFMGSEAFRADMAGFPMGAIEHVDAVLLEAAPSSPLR